MTDLGLQGEAQEFTWPKKCLRSNQVLFNTSVSYWYPSPSNSQDMWRYTIDILNSFFYGLYIISIPLLNHRHFLQSPSAAGKRPKCRHSPGYRDSQASTEIHRLGYKPHQAKSGQEVYPQKWLVYKWNIPSENPIGKSHENWSFPNWNGGYTPSYHPFLEGDVPDKPSILIILGGDEKSWNTIQLLGYPHDYGNHHAKNLMENSHHLHGE